MAALCVSECLSLSQSQSLSPLSHTLVSPLTPQHIRTSMHSNRLSTVVCATIPLLARQPNIYMPHDILLKFARWFIVVHVDVYGQRLWTIAPSGQPTGPLSFCQEPLSASLARVGCHPALAQCSHGQESRFLCTRHWCGPTPTPTVAQLEEFSRIPPLRSYSVVRLYGCYCAVCTTVFCVGNSVSGGAGGQCVLKMRRWGSCGAG